MATFLAAAELLTSGRCPVDRGAELARYIAEIADAHAIIAPDGSIGEMSQTIRHLSGLDPETYLNNRFRQEFIEFDMFARDAAVAAGESCHLVGVMRGLWQPASFRMLSTPIGGGARIAIFMARKPHPLH